MPHPVARRAGHRESSARPGGRSRKAAPAGCPARPVARSTRPAGGRTRPAPASCVASGHSRRTGSATAPGRFPGPGCNRRRAAPARRPSTASTSHRRRCDAGPAAARARRWPVATDAGVPAALAPGQTAARPGFRSRSVPGLRRCPARGPGTAARADRARSPAAGCPERHARNGCAGFHDGRPGHRSCAAGRQHPAHRADARPAECCRPSFVGRAARGTIDVPGHRTTPAVGHGRPVESAPSPAQAPPGPGRNAAGPVVRTGS
ncbi:hypothetical protein D3C78_987330 [compost metagenome]